MINPFNKKQLYPWSNNVSIYENLKEQINQRGKIDNEQLPDDDEFWGDKPLRWVAGGLDSSMGHYSTDNSQAEIMNLVQLLIKQTNKPSNKHRKILYIKLMHENTLNIIDPLLEAIQVQSGIDYENLYKEAIWFAEKGAHRNVVKFGIALLGLFKADYHLDLIITLGKHEEFTLFTAVAIQNSIDDSTNQLFELAKCVDGWGRINLVERLKPETKEIKEWLLIEGYKNSIMYEYLSYICAVNGELHIAISNDNIDLDLYEGSGDIISALIAGGPAEDIDDYEHAPSVIGDFLRHSVKMCSSIQKLNDVLDIYVFLKDEEGWVTRFSKDWNPVQRDLYIRVCNDIINNKNWESIIWEGLDSENRLIYWNCVRAAKNLNIDIWDKLFRQLNNEPVNSSLYFELMQNDTAERVVKLVNFAMDHLPIKEIASGPGEEMGLGKDFEAHNCLDFILQELDKYVGIGKGLVTAGLRSPVIRNRNMAINVLEAWPSTIWGESLISDVKNLFEIEPTSDIKERLKNLINEKVY